MESKHSLFKSFYFAFEGLNTTLFRGRNFRFQFISGILAIALGFVLKLEFSEWAILIITIIFVLVLELINTSLESIVNIVSPEVRPEAKVAKDVAAASVLLASTAAIFVGALLFLPKII